MTDAERLEMPVKSFRIMHCRVNHGVWKGVTKEEAFKEARKWYGPHMPRWIELFNIQEVTK